MPPMQAPPLQQHAQQQPQAPGTRSLTPPGGGNNVPFQGLAERALAGMAAMDPYGNQPGRQPGSQQVLSIVFTAVDSHAWAEAEFIPVRMRWTSTSACGSLVVCGNKAKMRSMASC